eukprot:CAMPEP_0175828414 /NCGR_PEP_ID=MMETSP0107_2-20121207/12794_1 /TAXON_ID=195067 ORGANISM="Goniomonas pacifica, Strain CCMP1869" /NCGR_SAMPLE_ID=MMETSP0107_2 /ASSEMBLY_ACC=CAM_ASM_000203 /LENGTH=123 /DNA_ID=CAMNT_0017141135 /DNA_START=267 /DNA_END=641 /DNA_ORIENTATION=-
MTEKEEQPHTIQRIHEKKAVSKWPDERSGNEQVGMPQWKKPCRTSEPWTVVDAWREQVGMPQWKKPADGEEGERCDAKEDQGVVLYRLDGDSGESRHDQDVPPAPFRVAREPDVEWQKVGTTN